MQSLEDKLIAAKQVMNKLDAGNYERGNINTNMIGKSPEELNEIVKATGHQGGQPSAAMTAASSPGVYEQRVQASRLPDHIKKIMVENPIQQPDITLNNTLDVKFASKIAEKMEKMQLMDKPKGQASSQRARAEPSNSAPAMGINEAVLREMKPLIAEIIESTIERILEEKLRTMESKAVKVNENLQIKVGDTVFLGKITSAKSIKGK